MVEVFVNVALANEPVFRYLGIFFPVDWFRLTVQGTRAVK